MKRILFALGILALVLPSIRQAAAADVSIDFFYDNLGDDGSWVEVGDYGYCWQPNVASTNANWRPYSDGYWAYTDVGWTWVSNEDFGWATYHYGRWARLQDVGWVWVPGREWGPAWVSWRTGGDYVGWAPLPPQRVANGEVVYEGRPITNRVDIDFDIGPTSYNFVDVRYIGEPALRERILRPEENVTYVNRTVNVTNITYNDSRVYNHGPDFDRLNRYSTRKIQRLNLERESNVDLSAAVHSRGVTKVEGNKLMIAAPLTFAKPVKAIAPKTVKTKIEKPNLEHGWSGINNPKEKAELEAKIKKEDPKKVPPPDIQAASSTGAPPAPGANPSPTETNPVAATETPMPQATPMATGADRKGQHGNRQLQATPSVTASVTPATSATPAVSPNEQKRDGKNEKRNDRGHARPTPMSPTSSAAPQVTPADVIKPEQKPERKGRASLPATSTVAPVATPSEPTAKEPAHGEKEMRRGPVVKEQSPKVEHPVQPMPRDHAAPKNEPTGDANAPHQGHGKPTKEEKKGEKEATPAPQQ